MRIIYFVLVMVVTAGVILAVDAVDASGDLWRAIATGAIVALLFSHEQRFVAYWRMRKARRYLDERPIARRLDR